MSTISPRRPRTTLLSFLVFLVLAGLAPGDAILAVDGVPVIKLGFNGAIQRIRGPEGSTVVLSVRKAGGEVIQLEVIRRKIRG